MALRGTREDDEDSAFLGTFRAWRATWRRTLGVSVLGAGLSVLVVANWLFLLSRETPLAIVLLGAMVPVTVLLLLVLVHFPAAVAWEPDGVARTWLRTSLALSLASPLRSLVDLRRGRHLGRCSACCCPRSCRSSGSACPSSPVWSPRTAGVVVSTSRPAEEVRAGEGGRTTASLPLVVLLADTFTMALGFYMLVPLLAFHLLDDLSLTVVVVGILAAVRSGSQQGLMPWSGTLADRFGHRRAIGTGVLVRASGFGLFAVRGERPGAGGGLGAGRSRGLAVPPRQLCDVRQARATRATGCGSTRCARC